MHRSVQCNVSGVWPDQNHINRAKISGFDEAVLAKLMILEYSELPLFKQLYDWQISQEGQPLEVKELEEYCKEGTNIEKKEQLEKDYSNWARDKLIKWISVDPKLQDIDLRDYFWISRDQISSSILGASLVPPIVKTLFNKLNQDGLPATASKNIIRTEVKSLGESELNHFLIFSNSMLKKNKEQKRLYDIFHYLIEESVDGAETNYQDALENITVRNVEPAVGNGLKRINASESFRSFLNNFFKDNKSPASKAYNLK